MKVDIKILNKNISKLNQVYKKLYITTGIYFRYVKLIEQLKEKKEQYNLSYQ